MTRTARGLEILLAKGDAGRGVSSDRGSLGTVPAIGFLLGALRSMRSMLWPNDFRLYFPIIADRYFGANSQILAIGFGGVQDGANFKFIDYQPWRRIDAS